MSTAPEPAFSTRGAVDLSALQRPQSPPPGEPGGAPAAGGYVIDLTEESFPRVVQGSATYPVIVLLWIPTDQANAELGTLLGRLADEYAGRFLLARVDAQALPQVAAAFRVEGVPTVVAVLQGQPLPLFQGGAAEEQVRDVLDEVLAAAEQNGVTGRAPASGASVAPDGQVAGDAAPQPEPELPPLHQEAFDAIDQGDYDGAVAAYEQALRQDPKDAMASAGLAQVRLLQRTRDVDQQAVRKAAADAPGDVAAQFTVADVDVLFGNVEDAFDRVLGLLPAADADAKERVRLRMLEYFEVVGVSDPRVLKARQRLALYLY